MTTVKEKNEGKARTDPDYLVTYHIATPAAVWDAFTESVPRSMTLNDAVTAALQNATPSEKSYIDDVIEIVGEAEGHDSAELN